MTEKIGIKSANSLNNGFKVAQSVLHSVDDALTELFNQIKMNFKENVNDIVSTHERTTNFVTYTANSDLQLVVDSLAGLPSNLDRPVTDTAVDVIKECISNETKQFAEGIKHTKNKIDELNITSGVSISVHFSLN